MATLGSSTHYHHQNGQAVAEYQADQLYLRACDQNWLALVKLILTRQSRGLLDLAQVQANCTVLGQHRAGVKQVPIRQIRGSFSQGRSQDFDADFRPLNPHNKSRWLRLAVARQLGTKIPPVSLIQVGDFYFVEDGHHRISVARAWGEQEIEAEVTVWQVAGPLPWQEALGAPQDS